MQLTKDFNVIEFACHDGTAVPQNLLCNVQSLAEQLQVLRDDAGVPILIMSGYRTKEHNRKVGGATRSQHLLAKAGDLVTKTLTPKQLHARIEKLIKAGKMKNGGLGLYKTFVHYDIGPVRRWNG
jgi:uncharacterized protein YcbK (DUF882 family)